MKAHRTDLLSFAFGLVFLALSAWWLLAQLLGLALPPVGWFLAGALILIGVFGLVGALRSGRSGGPEPNGSAGPAATPATVAPEPVAPWTAAAEPGAAEPGASWTAVAEPGASWTAAAEPGASSWTAAAEPPTAELRTPDASTDGTVHPAWLAHAPAESETSPVTARPADTTRVDHHPVTPAGENRAADPPAEKSAADKDPAASDDQVTGDDPAGADERAGRREVS